MSTKILQYLHTVHWVSKIVEQMSWIFVMDLGVLLWLQKALHPPNKGHPCSLKSTCDPPSQQSGCGALEFSSQMSACTGRQPRPNTRMLCALRPTIVKKKGNQTHHKSHPTYCLLCYDIRSIQQQKKQKHNGKYNHLATSSSNTTSIKKKMTKVQSNKHRPT